jgi:hypothetical protein
MCILDAKADCIQNVYVGGGESSCCWQAVTVGSADRCVQVT